MMKPIFNNANWIITCIVMIVMIITLSGCGGSGINTPIINNPPSSNLTISSFSPANGTVGTTVAIIGNNFTGTTAVKFNGKLSTNFNVVSSTLINATVPTGASTGKISVIAQSDTTTSLVNFVINSVTSDTQKTNAKDGATMIWVSDGNFIMGTDYDSWYDASFPHEVTLSGYWIYKYEVTVAQYRTFCNITSHQLPPWPGNYYSWAGKTGWTDLTIQQHPIVNINWNDAKAYADWAGVSLPTEAQWEYAARGPRGYNYPWGGIATLGDPSNGWDPTKCANYFNSYNQNISTWPVGSFPAGASWCGVEDLSGNVAEWCADWFDKYPLTSVINPIGPDTGVYRVMRGGSWDDYDFLSYYRNAIRSIYMLPSSVDRNSGFRCVSKSTVTGNANPTISNISPTSGDVGSVVTITGSNFIGVTSIKFNGVIVKTISNNTTTSLKVTVPNGVTTGKITIVTLGGMATSTTDFTVSSVPILPPSITSFTPISGAIGTIITITGTNLTGATEVKFNGIATSTLLDNTATSLKVMVPVGATTGKISVTTSGGIASNSNNFIVTLLKPTITSFTPSSGIVGTIVTIIGTNFSDSTIVKFNGVQVTSLVNNNTTSLLKVAVPLGSTSGKISVTTGGGTSLSISIFSVIPPPAISSFSPINGVIGTVVVINGANLSGVASVKFNNTISTTITDNTTTSLKVVVPNGATTGKITIYNSNGIVTSLNNFTVYQPPSITSLSSSYGAIGDIITVIGTNLDGVLSVSFNDTPVTDITNKTHVSLDVKIPINATTGKISITTPGGTVTSIVDFVVYQPPTIISFSPISGVAGTSITIFGTNLIGTSLVTFNDMTTTTIINDSPTSLTVTVPVGASSGKINIVSLGGNVTSNTDFVVIIPEKINPIDGAKMVWVPSGTFMMGSKSGIGNSIEQPMHNVTLSGFWIYKYEVTVAQYRAFCIAKGRQLPSFPQWGTSTIYSWQGKSGWDDPTLQQHPIINVTWSDCVAYSTWAGVYIPTEAQWEYVARGPQGRNYSWGGVATLNDKNNGWDQNKCANTYNSFSKDISTWPVGSFLNDSSWCNAQDIAGNVSEWCYDWFGNYTEASITNPNGVEIGEYRVLRGGNFSSYNASSLRGVNRSYGSIDYFDIGIGFRCVSLSQ